MTSSSINFTACDFQQDFKQMTQILFVSFLVFNQVFEPGCVIKFM